jgi:hypothetical protein
MIDLGKLILVCIVVAAAVRLRARLDELLNEVKRWKA